jgi:hypothetical protein
MYSFTYSGGVWSSDVSNVTVPSISQAINSCIAVATRWSTVTVIAVEYESSQVLIKHSTDDGATWGADTVILGSLGSATGIVDATEFSWDSGSGSNNYLGVAVSPNGGSEDVYWVYIKEGDTITTAGNWTVENASTLASYSDDADDHISIVRDGSATNNRIYFATKRDAGTGASHAVFKRDNNTSGTWSVTENALAESRPAIGYDATNDEVYVWSSDTINATPIEYEKSSAPTLSFGSGTTILENSTDAFSAVAGSHDPCTSTSGLLIVGGNNTDGLQWEAMITLAAPAGGGMVSSPRVQQIHHILRR